MLRFRDPDGNLQLAADREALQRFFQDNINRKTMFFHSLEEKIKYLVENNYYDKTVLDKYEWADIKSLFKQAYAHKFRFSSFIGAFKYYQSYTLRTNDGANYLERYEDRVVMNALTMGNGDVALASKLVDAIIQGHYQPATPTFN